MVEGLLGAHVLGHVLAEAPDLGLADLVAAQDVSVSEHPSLAVEALEGR